jgi:predicted RNA binding protein YcfA (HicA-like mRNA interferase family)
MSVGALIQRLEAEGWRLIRSKGNPRQFRNPHRPGTVTVAGESSLDVPPRTLSSVLKLAGLEEEGTE